MPLLRKNSRFFGSSSPHSFKGVKLQELNILREYVIILLGKAFNQDIQNTFSSFYQLINRYQLSDKEFKSLPLHLERCKNIIFAINRIITQFEQLIAICLKEKSPELSVENIKPILDSYFNNDGKISTLIPKKALSLSNNINLKEIAAAMNINEISEEYKELSNIYVTTLDFEKLIDDDGDDDFAPSKELSRKLSKSRLISRKFSLSSQKTPEAIAKEQEINNKKSQIISRLKLALGIDETNENKKYFNYQIIKYLIQLFKYNELLTDESAKSLKDIFDCIVLIQTYKKTDNSHPLYYVEKNIIQKIYSDLKNLKQAINIPTDYLTDAKSYLDGIHNLHNMPFTFNKAANENLALVIIYTAFRDIEYILESILIHLVTKIANNEELYKEMLTNVISILKELYKIFPTKNSSNTSNLLYKTQNSLYKETDPNTERAITEKLEALCNINITQDKKLIGYLDNFKIVLKKYLEVYKSTIVSIPLIIENSYLYTNNKFKNDEVYSAFYNWCKKIRDELVTSAQKQDKKNSNSTTHSTYTYLYDEQNENLSLYNINSCFIVFDGYTLVKIENYLKDFKNADIECLYFSIFPEQFTVSKLIEHYSHITPTYAVSRTKSAPTERTGKEVIPLPQKSLSFSPNETTDT